MKQGGGHRPTSSSSAGEGRDGASISGFGGRLSGRHRHVVTAAVEARNPRPAEKRQRKTRARRGERRNKKQEESRKTRIKGKEPKPALTIESASKKGSRRRRGESAAE